VLDGLKEGEEVVTSAQFLIDSESKLHEATAKMMEPSTPQKPDPNRLIMEQGAHRHD
jgi:Cu(I)/Ag(I) efflux system membrane fusion protein